MNYQGWYWISLIFGAIILAITLFALEDRLNWWLCWWINIFIQVGWYLYIFSSHQYFLILSAGTYSVLFFHRSVHWFFDRSKWDVYTITPLNRKNINKVIEITGHDLEELNDFLDWYQEKGIELSFKVRRNVDGSITSSSERRS